MQTQDLTKLREQIDEIDAQLVALLERRLDVVNGVIAYKIAQGKPIYDAKREQEKIERLKGQARPETCKFMEEMLRDIMKTSKKYQKAATDAFVAEKMKEMAKPQTTEMPEYGLLGKKLGHSFSPMLHKTFGGYEYGLFEKTEDELEDFLKNGTFKGINVTIPYKKAVLPYLADMSDIAKRTNSVNVIVRREDGSLYGDNTDYGGLKFSMERKGISVGGKKVVILGDGGVSATVLALMEDMGVASCVTISRRGENNYLNLAKHFDAEVIINTTPVGMFPDNGNAVISLKQFTRCETVIDLIFNPLRTKLLLEAEKLGMTTLNGLDMLVAQAALACEKFIGVEITPQRIASVCNDMALNCSSVILIGMPGCGKTSIGKALAEELDYPFLDCDEEVAKDTGRMPSDIICRSGEDTFRMYETQTLERVTRRNGIVLSCGGGVVTRPENLDLLRQNGVVVYIRRSLEELEQVDRPLSQLRTVEVLFEERKQLYLDFADVVVDNKGTISDAVALIMEGAADEILGD